MQNPRLAKRYAKSILDLAIEKGKLDEVFADMQNLNTICKGNRDFVNLVNSPVVAAATKQKIVTAVIDGKVGDLTKAFLSLLISKHRESNLPVIVTSFIDLYKTHKNIYIAKLTTATPVSEETKNAFIEQVKKASGYDTVELETKIDPSLIGGFVLQVGDKMVDASIAYDLRTLAKQFDNNDFIYAVR